MKNKKALFWGVILILSVLVAGIALAGGAPCKVCSCSSFSGSGSTHSWCVCGHSFQVHRYN